MPTWGWILIGIAVVLAAAIAIWAVSRRQRTERLRERFGPEYDRTVDSVDSRAKAESDLEARYKRRQQLDIRPLPAGAGERFATAWVAAQARFVDHPAEAVGEADRLIVEVMRARGYPMDSFEQRAADVSVDHPTVVENYRAAHAISVTNEQGQASTEDLRQAMVHYRSLFEELLESDGSTPASDRTATG